MIRVALRGLAGRKFRASLTALAVVLGVAMVSGTFVLTDTIDKAFDAIFSESYANTDAAISGKAPDISFEGSTAEALSVPANLLEDVRELDGVEAATGSVADETATKILKPDGKAINTQGAPSFGFGIDPEESQFNPLRLVEGAWPTAPDDVVIDATTADEQGYGVGDSVKIATLKPVQSFRISGIAQYGSVSSLGTATFAVFTIPTAQQLLDREVHSMRSPWRPPTASRPSSSSRTSGRSFRRPRRCAPVSRRPRRRRARSGVHDLHPLLPARVRRGRPLRGRLRDLQHDVDHGRAADA